MKVGIISFGGSNITSVINAVHKIGYKTIVLNKPDRKVDFLMMPGVGNFGTAARKLEDSGFLEYIKNHIKEGKPMMGICLGMQLLFETSAEDDSAHGLCFYKGHFEKIPEPMSLDQRSPPNIGYNFVEFTSHSSESSAEIDLSYLNGYYYFLHSYALSTIPMETKIIGISEFNNKRIIPFVLKENICGIQFHPERSGLRGLNFLSKVINMLE
jgi:imidazole glycerol phosphate synthase glutamine amidotransferase subunit